MCDHNDKLIDTYLAIMDPAGEFYMCECGALINIADTASCIDDCLSRPVTPDELKKAISLIALEAVRHAKSSVGRAINGVEQDWLRKGGGN